MNRSRGWRLLRAGLLGTAAFFLASSALTEGNLKLAKNLAVWLKGG